ncbi:MAG: DUF134 domain-containing protein [Spirochaetaceae bacterium]|nr:MAG: DUF134 domain-containing protein [Spirochaetaceae bacterium]
MPRPRKKRLVQHPPIHSAFKPCGVKPRHLTELQLSLDEYEAIRLADFAGMDHESSAREMQISRSTFTRLLDQAHSKLASFLIEGKLLVIGGGSVHFSGNCFVCQDCGHIFYGQLEQEIKSCPMCDSKELQDGADLHGHGQCCLRWQNRDVE